MRELQCPLTPRDGVVGRPVPGAVANKAAGIGFRTTRTLPRVESPMDARPPF